MLMGDIPLTWMINGCNDNTTWTEFETGMKQKFGDSKQTVLAHIKHRMQEDDEPVHAYIDEMRMLLSQLAISEDIKVDLTLQNMTHWFKTQVIQTIPRSLEDLINSAIFIEDKTARACTFDKAKSWQQPQSNDQRESLDHFSIAAQEWSTAANSWRDQMNTANYGGLCYPELDRPRQRQRCLTCNRSSKHCKCQKDTCRAAERLWTDPYKDVPTQILESQAYNVRVDFEFGDCKPSSPETLEYAKRSADSHEQQAQRGIKREQGKSSVLQQPVAVVLHSQQQSLPQQPIWQKQSGSQLLRCCNVTTGMHA